MTDNNQIEWELPVCNFCKGEKIKILLNDVRYWEHPYSFKIVKCKDCGLIFLNPRPKQKYIGQFYKSDAYWGKDIKKESEKSNKNTRDEIYKPIYDIIGNEKGKIIDIGAGTGLFLSKFKDRKWEIDGIEFSKEAVAYANKSFGLKLKTGDFLDHSFKENKYDYVVMDNVLEHLYKPIETLKAIKKILKTNGKIIIVVPNIDSLGFKIFTKNWYPLQPPIHLYYFSPKSLRMMMDSVGFKINKIDHSYFLHNYFSLFESFRSQLTGRNYVYSKPDNELKGYDEKNKRNLIREIGVHGAKLFSFFLSNIGTFIKKGESIIIVAEKK